MQRIFQLQGKVQHYSWGGFDFIPNLLGIYNTDQKPFAEYWMGAHTQQPSKIHVGSDFQPLDQFINHQTEAVLGKKVSSIFPTLPYLFKVLDVRQMLSIQVHPSKEAAKECFAKENKNGIPLLAQHRNYKDDNHKPEMMVALSTFWLLHGFKSETAMTKALAQTPEFHSLYQILKQKGLKDLYSWIMSMPQDEVNKILQPLADRILPLYNAQSLEKTSEDFWAARAIKTFTKNDQLDRGIFSIYLLNLVCLQKGEGIYQPSGMPHAYLEGQNVELMANSDNVLRAGLTDKHIDVPELMKHLNYDETVPDILHVGANSRYTTPAEEFGLFRYSLATNHEEKWQSDSAEMLLVLEGQVEVFAVEEQVVLKKGQTLFIIANTSVQVKALEPSTMFRATVGIM